MQVVSDAWPFIDGDSSPWLVQEERIAPMETASAASSSGRASLTLVAGGNDDATAVGDAAGMAATSLAAAASLLEEHEAATARHEAAPTAKPPHLQRHRLLPLLPVQRKQQPQPRSAPLRQLTLVSSQAPLPSHSRSPRQLPPHPELLQRSATRNVQPIAAQSVRQSNGSTGVVVAVPPKAEHSMQGPLVAFNSNKEIRPVTLSRSWRFVVWAEGLPSPYGQDLPDQADIWSSGTPWVSMLQWHPVSMISRINDGTVHWSSGSYVSWSCLVMLSFVCYPVLFIAAVFLLTCIVSASLREAIGGDHKPLAVLGGSGERYPTALEEGVRRDPLYSRPVMLEEHLTAWSRAIYRMWLGLCRLLPSVLVFGVPLFIVFCSVPLPQEVFIVLSLFVSTLVFSNGVYLVVFTSTSILQMSRAMSVDYGARIGVPKATRLPLVSGVTHWVIVPQYQEDVEIVAAMLKSITASNIAKASISVCLAMEEREDNVQVKVETLKAMFQQDFAEILVSFHPASLRNHPPGKASNTAWAYMVLIQHLRRNGMDMSKVILTVSDADSEFHRSYFECLTHSYLQTAPEKRDICIWQSPILHLKNYHRQPFLVAVGTMFTCLQDLALLADPNTVRFPYSTYSLSLTLARRVGGWDPQWIAEDWHMGIKCFILTGGRSYVEPLLLPTVNFTPEESTWWKTINARWVQAKRHALGFSDFMYFFSMLPLYFGHAASAARKHGYLTSLLVSLRVFLGGIPVIVKFVNVHVILGILTPFSSITFLLKMLMSILMENDRDIGYLVKHTDWSLMVMMLASYASAAFTFGLFVAVYELVRDRIDGPAYKSIVVHFFTAIFMFIVFGPSYFFMLGCAVWRAVLSVLMSDTFEYEVAPKPVASNMSGKAPGSAPSLSAAGSEALA